MLAVGAPCVIVALARPVKRDFALKLHPPAGQFRLAPMGGEAKPDESGKRDFDDWIKRRGPSPHGAADRRLLVLSVGDRRFKNLEGVLHRIGAIARPSRLELIGELADRRRADPARSNLV